MGRIQVTGRGRRWLEGGHPWVFANDVALEEAEPGDLVAVEDPAGRRIGWALCSTGSKIRARIVSREAEPPGRGFWAARTARAVAQRARHGFLAPEGACRLLAGDADGFPGFVVDRYAGVLVVQSGTQGADRLRDEWLELLEAALPFPVAAVVERSESSVRKLEGLEQRKSVLRGAVPGPVDVRDGDLVYAVDVLGGHKTGHYLDQRDNRRRAAARAAGARVLDAFCYDGLFGVLAALGGAREVLCIDQSEAALARARENAERNGVAALMRFERQDAMRDLRERERAGERWDVVVLDPPAFARNKTELAGAERGYRELNLRALKLLEPGGALVSASCSHAVRPELFLAFLARAAHDAGRSVWLEELAGASLDHPHLVTLPETQYLKCAFLRVG